MHGSIMVEYHTDKHVIAAHTDGRTDTQTDKTQATKIPQGQNWPRIKMNEKQTQKSEGIH